MATSTIKKSYPSINGVAVVGNKTLAEVNILTTEMTVTLAQKSVPSSGTVTSWPTITLAAGTWICNLDLYMSSSSGTTGNFGIALQNSSGQNLASTRQVTGCPNSGGIRLNSFFVLDLSASTTYTPVAYQQNGGNRNISGVFHAIKW